MSKRNCKYKQIKFGSARSVYYGPRQSGKTQRLIELAVKLVSEGKNVFFVTHSRQLIKSIESRILDEIQAKGLRPALRKSIIVDVLAERMKYSTYVYDRKELLFLIDELDYAFQGYEERFIDDFLKSETFYAGTMTPINGYAQYLLKKLKKMKINLHLLKLRKTGNLVRDTWRGYSSNMTVMDESDALLTPEMLQTMYDRLAVRPMGPTTMMVSGELLSTFAATPVDRDRILR